MKEKLGARAAVKGSVVHAHLAWADTRLADARSQLRRRLGPECAGFTERSTLLGDWVPLRCLVAIDRAIAAEVGGTAEDVYRELGRHSASMNLSGAYRTFAPEEPHRFFDQLVVLHERFQNFGRPSYERGDERIGRFRIEGSDEFSPVFCASGLGYFEGALLMMKVPGPVHCVEASCQCAGAGACLFELSW
jgi:predicted hydrocarbon binding protein